MSKLFRSSKGQIKRLRPSFPKTFGKPRVDGLQVLCGVIYTERRGLMWKDAPREYVPPKTHNNRWKRWSRLGVLVTIMTELATQAQQTEMALTLQDQMQSTCNRGKRA